MADAASGRIAFELVSPERLLVSRDVDMVVVPGEEGDFGALPGHAPFMSSVRPGTVEVYEGEEASERLFVAGGFAEVTPDRCTVLAEEAFPLADVARTDAAARLADAERALGEARDDAERAAAETARAVAAALLEAIDYHGAG